MRNRSLTIKIFGAIALTFLILGIAIYFFIYLSFPQKYMENKKKNVTEKVNICLLKFEDENLTNEDIKKELIEISLREDVYIDVYFNDKYLYSINSQQSYSIEDMREEIQVDIIVDRRLDEYEKVSVKRVCSEGVIDADIYVPIKLLEDVEKVLLSTYPAIIVITIIMIVLLSLVAAYQISRPIILIINKVNDMSQFRHKPKRIDGYNNLRDEIKLLDVKIEDMYYMLRESQINMENEMKNQMKQEKLKFDFFRMAAHELKTPLTSVNGMLEGMYYNIPPYNNREHYLSECQNIIGDMNCLIKKMLSSTEYNSQCTKENVNIKKLIQKITDMFVVERIKKNVELVIDISDDEICYTNKEMFESALKNVIHNAVIYCAENGVISISLRDGLIYIFNECEPLGEEELEMIFKGIYKSLDSNGNGLGLYLVKRFLDILKIKFSLERSCLHDNLVGMTFKIDIKSM